MTNDKIIAIDKRRNSVIPGNEQTTLQYSVQHFINAANNAIHSHGYFAVALSGGSTPKAIYKGLASPENRKKIDWAKVLLFWSDERCVSKDHPDSNYKMAMDAAFSQLPLKPQHIFAMNGIGNLEENAIEYEQLIKSNIPSNRFDLVMLGLGEDGHTASLFPHTKGLHEEKRLVIPNFIPEKNVWRLTLTFDCINAAEQIAIYVIGASKAEIVKKVLNGKYDPEEYPVQKVGTEAHQALWIMDEGAAKESVL